MKDIEKRFLLEKIFDFMIDDAFTSFQRVNTTITHFREYIYNDKGNYKNKNSKFISDFISLIDCILLAFNNSKVINFKFLRTHLIDLALLKNESEA